MTIQIFLEDHTGNTQIDVKISDTATIQQLIPAIISLLELPDFDQAGRRITYRLNHNDRALNEGDTLRIAQVNMNDTITVVPEFTAGATEDALMDALPLIVPLSILHKRQPMHGFPSGYHYAAPAAPLHIQFPLMTKQQIWEHTRSHTEQEVGGVLVGQVYEDHGSYLVTIEQAWEAKHSQSGRAFVTFTNRTWLDIIYRKQQQSSHYIVGWYHSHPGFGVFLSSQDKFTHCSFFGHLPWYLALVVDPLANEWGFFTNIGGLFARCKA